MRRFIYRTIVAVIAIAVIPVWAIYGAGYGLLILWDKASEQWREV